jgi:hypothetical protein
MCQMSNILAPPAEKSSYFCGLWSQLFECDRVSRYTGFIPGHSGSSSWNLSARRLSTQHAEVAGFARSWADEGSGGGKKLQNFCFLETEETPADDDVIQEIDLKNLRSRRHAPSPNIS